MNIRETKMAEIELEFRRPVDRRSFIGGSDARIIKALETSVSMVYRVRKQLVEEGFEAVLSRKQRTTPAVPRRHLVTRNASLALRAAGVALPPTVREAAAR